MEKYCFAKDQRALMEGLSVPFAVYQFIDNKVVPVVLSEGFCELFAYPDLTIAYQEIERGMYREIHPDDANRIENAAIHFATKGGDYEIVFRMKKYKIDQYSVIHSKGKHVVMEDGTKLAYIWYTDEGLYVGEPKGQVSRLSEALSQALHEESIIRHNNYDILTGLPSMTYFLQIVEMKRNDTDNKDSVMLFFDLNGMKFFNSNHGFAEGDKLLKAFAKVLVSFFANDCCCHVSGDHFAVLAKDRDLEETLQELLVACKTMNDGKSLPVRVGVYRMEDDVPASIALDRAKLACDGLRDTYHSSFNYFREEMRERGVLRQYILGNLDNAIEHRWIKVYYQPLVRAVHGRVCDEEALARWIDPVKGFLSPAEFIPFLEGAGIIYKLDLYVLEEVLRKMKRFRDEGCPVVPHSINLSRSDFDGRDMVEEIRKRVDEAGIAREMITIEITESVIGSDFEYMKEQVERFRSLGFPVWMDDFGSGYSSLDVLQMIKFDLIKFDMSFMQRLDEGESGKIILTELMRMATALGVDTACEGVEKEGQVRFLQDIGCSKIQGYYYQKPMPEEYTLDKFRSQSAIGYENMEEAAYYETIGRVNLYDLAFIASEDDNAFQNIFNTIPMSIVEVHGEDLQFVRTNQSYRDFMRRFFGLDVSDRMMLLDERLLKKESRFMKIVKECSRNGGRAFFDEGMADGTLLHVFARRIGENLVTGKAAVAVAVLSITEPNNGATYASIARALAADFYNIYYVDMETERFIEYSSPVGGEELAIERHGERFFETMKKDVVERIYKEDQEPFLLDFTKDNITRELATNGSFRIEYRRIDTGEPVYVSLKTMRMHGDDKHVIMGISVIDAQIKHREERYQLKTDRNTYARLMALGGGYLSLYSIDAKTGKYREYSTTDQYDSLGVSKKGDDFFLDMLESAKRTVYSEDLPEYMEKFTKENLFQQIKEKGSFTLHHRLMINGEPKRVSLRMALVKESDGEILIAGIREWIMRK